MAQERISCTFSLFDEGRKYTGHHRKYLVENAREVCYSKPVREKIRLREALGFYGHGRRVLAGRMNLGEVEAITLPDGTSAIVSNIPSNVTVAFDVQNDGTVTHTQEILNTETGKIVSGLHASKVGGFSWACPGEDGGRKGVTRLTSFAGFDYVLNPGFAHNRGYVLESAGGMQETILESISAVLHDDALAQKYLNGWTRDYEGQLGRLQEALFSMEAENAEYRAERENLEKSILENAKEKEQLIAEKEALRQNMVGVFNALRDAFPVFIPDKAMHAMLDGDLDRAKSIFEAATRIDFSQFPLKGVKPEAEPVQPGPKRQRPEYGSLEYGEGMWKDEF